MVIACVVAMIWYKKKFKAPETVNSYENGGPPVDNDEKLETCEMQVKIQTKATKLQTRLKEISIIKQASLEIA